MGEPALTFVDVSQSALLLAEANKLLDAYYRSILDSDS